MSIDRDGVPAGSSGTVALEFNVLQTEAARAESGFMPPGLRRRMVHTRDEHGFPPGTGFGTRGRAFLGAGSIMQSAMASALATASRTAEEDSDSDDAGLGLPCEAPPRAAWEPPELGIGPPPPRPAASFNHARHPPAAIETSLGEYTFTPRPYSIAEMPLSAPAALVCDAAAPDLNEERVRRGTFPGPFATRVANVLRANVETGGAEFPGVTRPPVRVPPPLEFHVPDVASQLLAGEWVRRHIAEICNARAAIVLGGRSGSLKDYVRTLDAWCNALIPLRRAVPENMPYVHATFTFPVVRGAVAGSPLPPLPSQFCEDAAMVPFVYDTSGAIIMLCVYFGYEQPREGAPFTGDSLVIPIAWMLTTEASPVLA